jgi:hypothetical protein
MIRELLKTEGSEGSLLNAALEVSDDAGEVVLEFPFSEALLDASDELVTKHSVQALPSFRGARSANPESRDSGSGPSDHPGMTAVKFSFARPSQ